MPVEIIYGPERSGKKRYLLQRAAETIRSKNSERILILVPSKEYWKSIPEMILKETSLQATFLPRLFTFESIADKIIRSTNTSLKKLDSIQSHYILVEIIKDFSKRKKLKVFEKSSQRTGFQNYIHYFIASMKQAEIPAEALLEKMDGGNPSLAEAAAIYKSYQDYLHTNNLYDNDGLFWKAKEILSEFKPDLFSDIDLLLVYGFTSFTYVQRDILKTIFGMIPNNIISLCYENYSQRDDLFNETAFIINSLKSYNPIMTSTSISDYDWLFRTLERKLFSKTPSFKNGSSIDKRCKEAIRLFNAPDAQTETETVVAKIKNLIIEKDLSPDKIAIICPVLKDYEKIIQREFKSAGIPYTLNSSISLNSTPLGSFFFKMLKSIINDLARRDLKMLAGSRFFFRFHNSIAQKETPNENSTVLSYPECSQIACGFIERSDIAIGIETWIKHLKFICSAQLTAVEKAITQSMITLLNDLLKIRNATDISEAGLIIKNILDKIVSEKNSWHSLSTDQIREEREVVKALERLLNLNLPVVRKDRESGICVALKEILFVVERIEIQLENIPEGRVLITNPYAFRGKRIKAMFFMGLNNGSFPKYQKSTRIPFYNEIVKLDAGYKNRLPRGMDMAQDQMILFYSILCSVDELITLSWIKNDESDKSIFINDVMHSFEGLKIETEFPFYIKPIFEKITNRKKLLQAVRLEISEGKTALSIENTQKSEKTSSIKNFGHDYIPENYILQNLKKYTSLSDIENRRESSANPDNYDGVLSNPKSLEIIAKKYTKDYQFTASKFKDFGICPFKFFSENVLRLKILEEKQDDLNQLDEGALYHLILYKFYTELRLILEEKQLKTYELLPKLYDLLEDVIEIQFNEMSLQGKTITTDFLNLKKDEIIKILKRFIKFDLLNTENFTPRWFEVGFGDLPGTGDIDPISISDPIILQSKNEKIYLAGKIDRIDLEEAGEKKNIHVIDYKLKSYPTIKAVENGTDFQLPIYIMAAEKIALSQETETPKITAQYISIKDMGKSTQFKKREDAICYGKDDSFDVLNLVKNYLFAYKKLIKSGFFPPFVKNDCAYCGQRRLCRYNPTRIELKRMPEMNND